MMTGQRMSREPIGFIEGSLYPYGSTTIGKRYLFTDDNCTYIADDGDDSMTSKEELHRWERTPIYTNTPNIKVLQEARDLLAYKKTLKPKTGVWIKCEVGKIPTCEFVDVKPNSTVHLKQCVAQWTWMWEDSFKPCLYRIPKE